MKRQISALLLASCLLLSSLSGAASAVEGGGQEAGLFLDKWVAEVPGEEDTFKLVLESYATGSNSTITRRPTPVDIVLVLDESGSMGDVLVEGCNGRYGKDVGVMQKGHMLNPGQGSTDVLFIGHKVMADDVDKEKEYTVFYPQNGSTRTVSYCSECECWRSNDKHNDEHYGLAEWIPFKDESGNPTESGSGATNNWKCDVQFYEKCERTGRQVLVEALQGFLTQLWNASHPSNPEVNEWIPNRVAIVGYGQGASYIYRDQTRKKVYLDNDGILAGNDDDLALWAAGAFANVAKDFDSEYNLVHWLDGIEQTGSTPTHLGLQAAQLAFEHAPDDEDDIERNKVMILFTDGAPGSGYVNYQNWAEAGLRAAKEMKGDGVTVYSVGLFPDADGYNANKISYNVNNNGQGTPGFFANANCFLHLVSSNYPDATGVESGNWGDLSGDYVEDEQSYYMGTSEADDLSKIFEQISSVVTPGSTTVTLDESAIVKDTVTDQFEITYDGGTPNVTAYTMSYTGDVDGKKTWEEDEGNRSTVDGGDLNVTVSGQKVNVTNFNFAKNYVHMEKDEDGNDIPAGKKLVIEIEIKATDAARGGIHLDTNKDKPGVYGPNDSTPVEEFPMPHVDLPTTVTIKKVVKGTETEENFSFSANWLENTAYKDTDERGQTGNSNYLEYQQFEDKTEDFYLADGGMKEIDDVAVETNLTISETPEAGYTTTVTTSTGETLTPDENGKYTVKVTPGMVITFTNATYTLRLKKVDNIDGTKLLPGAVFKLEKADGTELGEPKTTGEDGIAEWTGLEAGEYKLTELQAPDGYLNIKKTSSVTIPADSDSTTVEVTVTNGKAPEAGGPGTVFFITAGLAVLGGAAFALPRKKRRG